MGATHDTIRHQNRQPWMKKPVLKRFDESQSTCHQETENTAPALCRLGLAIDEDEVTKSVLSEFVMTLSCFSHWTHGTCGRMQGVSHPPCVHQGITHTKGVHPSSQLFVA
jgi:hypothetical protein